MGDHHTEDRLPDDPPTPGRTRPDDETVGMLAAEAVSLVVGGCATRVAIRVLRQRAGTQADRALEQAAERCQHAELFAHRVGRAAAQLLRGAAAESRLARRRSATGTIRP